MSVGTSPTLSLLVQAKGAVAQFEAMAKAGDQLAAALIRVKEAGGAGVGGLQALKQEAGAVNSELMQVLRTIEAGLSAHMARVENLEKESATRRRAAKKAAAAADLADEEAALAEQLTAAEVAYAKLHGISLKTMVMGGGATGTTSAVGLSQGNLISATAANKALLDEQVRAQTLMQKQDLESWQIRGAIQKENLAMREARDLEAWQILGAIQKEQQAMIEARDMEMWLMRGAIQKEQQALIEKRDMEMWLMRGAIAREGAASVAAASSGGVGRSVTRGLAGAAGMNMLTYGASIPAVVGGFAAAASIGESIKIGAEFQQQMAFVQVASDEGAASVKKVSDAILALGGQTMFTPTEMAEGMRKLAQSGYTVSDSFKMLPSVMNLAVLGEQTVGASAETVQGLMHAFNLEVGDTSHIVDVMAKAANISATDVGAMSQAMKQASTVAQQYNVTVDEMGGLLALLAQRNITGSMAGTTLTRMFMEFDPKSKSARDAMKALGVETNTTMSAMERIQVLSHAFNQFDQDSQNRLAVSFGNVRAAKGLFAAMAGADSTLPEFLEKIKGATGYAQEAVDTLGETTSKAWDRFKGALESTAIQAFQSTGDDLNKTLKSLATTVTEPEFVKGLSSLLTIFTGLALVIAKIVELAPKIKGASLGAAVPGYGFVAPLVGAVRSRLGASSDAAQRSGGQITQAYQSITSFEADSAAVSAPPQVDKKHWGFPDKTGDSLRKQQIADAKTAATQQMAIAQEEADFEMKMLNTKHQYGVIANADYLDQVRAVQAKLRDTEKAAAEKALADAAVYYASLTKEEDKKRALASLNALIAKQQLDATKAQHAEDLKAEQVKDAAIKRGKKEDAFASGIDSDLGKVKSTQLLKLAGERSTIDQATQPASVAILAAAKQENDKIWAAETEKLTKQLAEAQQKVDEGGTGLLPGDSSKQQVTILQQKIALIPQLSAALLAETQAQRLANLQTQQSFGQGWNSAFKTYSENAYNSATAARDIFTATTGAMTTAIDKFAKTGKISFNDFAQSVLSAMLKIEEQKMATGLMSGTSGIASTIAGWFHMAHTGGVIGSGSLLGRAVDPMVFAGASRYHTGGLVGNEVPIIAKQGEGVFTPDQMAALAPVGSGGNLQVNIIDQRSNSGSSPVQVTQRRGADGQRQLQILVRDAVRAAINNGDMDTTMQNNYNVGRPTVTR